MAKSKSSAKPAVKSEVPKIPPDEEPSTPVAEESTSEVVEPSVEKSEVTPVEPIPVDTSEPENTGTAQTDGSETKTPATDSNVKDTGNPSTVTHPKKEENTVEKDLEKQSKRNSVLLVAVLVLVGLLLGLGAFCGWYFFLRDTSNDVGGGNGNGNNNNGGDEEEVECEYDAELVEHVTVPAGTEFDAGEVFTKTWEVRNTGDCDWSDVQLIFSDGDPIGEDLVVNVADVEVNETTEVSLNLSAPATTGTYRSNWRLVVVGGDEFGDTLPLHIVVRPPVVEEPEYPDLVVTNVYTDPVEVRKGIVFYVYATIRNQGGADAVAFHWGWKACAYDTCPYIEAVDEVTLVAGQETTVEMEYTYGGWSTYTTSAMADLNGEVDESDETNNEKSLVLGVLPGLPDLVVLSVTFAPFEPVFGFPAQVTVGLRNAGSEPTAGGFWVDWWSGEELGPNPSCSSFVAAMDVGETKTVTCSYTYLNDWPSIDTIAVLDPTDLIHEVNESNNELVEATPVWGF